MKPSDDHEQARHATAADERLAADLAGLRPMAASADLRARIAADLASAVEPAASRAGGGLWRGVAERLAWAAAGAIAASLVLLVSRGQPASESAGPEAAAALARAVAEPAVSVEEGGIEAGFRSPRPRTSRMSEQPIAWSDEGIRFLDGVTPARIIRRRVIERHLADDGRAEVHVPREDVIFLPVALR
jgi:hypothetical protein